MKRYTPKFTPVNGRSFRIDLLNGAAPYKVVHLNADGSENFRTHHKTEALALAKCAVYHPDFPVVKTF